MALLRGPEPAPLPHQRRQAGHQHLDRGVLQPQSQARLGGDEGPHRVEKSFTSQAIAAEPEPSTARGEARSLNCLDVTWGVFLAGRAELVGGVVCWLGSAGWRGVCCAFRWVGDA